MKVDGGVVGDVKQLEAEGKPKRIEGLFSRLTEHRARFAREHPGEPLPIDAWIDVGPDAPLVVTTSAILTTAFTGYRHVHVRSDGPWVDADVAVPFDPFADANPAHTRLTLRLDGAKIRLVWQSDRACDVVPADSETTLSDLDANLQRTCEGAGKGCVDELRLRMAAGVRTGDMVAALRSARQRGGERLRFSILLVKDASAEPPLERSCGHPLGTHLPSKVIQERVHARMDKIRACYDAGRAKNPSLGRGVVVVRFEIGTKGTVTDASLVLSAAPGSPSTTLEDRGVGECIVGAFRELSFPPPDSDHFVVVYPVTLAP